MPAVQVIGAQGFTQPELRWQLSRVRGKRVGRPHQLMLINCVLSRWWLWQSHGGRERALAGHGFHR